MKISTTKEFANSLNEHSSDKVFNTSEFQMVEDDVCGMFHDLWPLSIVMKHCGSNKMLYENKLSVNRFID